MNKYNIGDVVEIREFEGMSCEIIQATLVKTPRCDVDYYIAYLVNCWGTGLVFSSSESDIISKIEESKE